MPLAFRREPGFTCVVNVGDGKLTLSDQLVAGGRIVLASQALDDGATTLPGATAAWLQTPD